MKKFVTNLLVIVTYILLTSSNNSFNEDGIQCEFLINWNFADGHKRMIADKIMSAYPWLRVDYFNQTDDTKLKLKLFQQNSDFQETLNFSHSLRTQTNINEKMLLLNVGNYSYSIDGFQKYIVGIFSTRRNRGDEYVVEINYLGSGTINVFNNTGGHLGFSVVNRGSPDITESYGHYFKFDWRIECELE